jgi:hypothetical protein
MINAGMEAITAKGVFQAFGTDTEINVKGEAIPLQVSKDQFVLFSLHGGKPIQVPGYGYPTSRHSIDQFKLLWITFSGEHGVRPLSIGGMLKNLKTRRPSKCIAPTILPEIYFAKGTANKEELKTVLHDELVDYGVEIQKICISVISEGHTNGRLATLFPWFDRLDPKNSLRFALVN